MRILPVDNFVYKKQTPSFTSYHTEVYKNNKLAYRTHTEFLRRDISWRGFANYIKDKYKNAERVNIVNHACSAGYETWTLLMVLKQFLESDFQKYMPIIARDIDESAIEYAKSGKLGLSGSEYLDALIYYERVFKENFSVNKREPSPAVNRSNEYILTCTTDLKNDIDFGCSDIFQDKELINKDNTVLLFRNCWSYLGEERVAELAYFLASNMKPTSLLVIGDFDYEFCIDKLLKDYGFKSTNIEFLYEAPGKPAKNSVENFPLVSDSFR